MTPVMIGCIGLVALVVLILLGVPVAFAMITVGFIGFSVLINFSAGLNILAQDIFTQFSSYSLTVIPMFMLMGSLAFESGISSRLYNCCNKWFGHYKGGLSIATIGTCAAFAAMCGSANAASAALGKVAVPEMDRYHYSQQISSGCVAAGGTLGVLIPPSTVFIVYGIITGESIGKLFISGILPGLLMTALFMGSVYLICARKPEMGPAGPKYSLHERMQSLTGIIEMLILFLLVMGGIFVGFFTPTEAGGVGAAGTLIIALIRRNMTWQRLKNAVSDTVKISCMLFLIVAGATVFGHFLAVSQIPFVMANFLTSLNVPPWLVITFIIAVYIVGGCFIDILPLIVLTVPIFLPVIQAMELSLIWFGVIIVIISQIGAITPPVGVCVYVIKGVCPDIPLSVIFKGCVPFLICMVITVTLVVIFPPIATFLPSIM